MYRVSSEEAPIQELVDRIHANTCIAPEFQTLYFAGAPVDVTKTFKDYLIREETRLYLQVLPGACDAVLLRVREGGVSSMQEALEVIEEVHSQTKEVCAAIEGVDSVKQYRYTAGYTCADNEPRFEVKETVVESDVGVVLSAFIRPKADTGTGDKKGNGKAAAAAGAGAGKYLLLLCFLDIIV